MTNASPQPNRRAFLGMLGALGMTAALSGTKAFAEAPAKPGSSLNISVPVPSNWNKPLGKYAPEEQMKPEDIAANRIQYTNYYNTKQDLVKAIEDAQGKTDPHSIRLQNFQQMVNLVKQIQDPLTQAHAVHAYIVKAIAYKERSIPNKKGAAIPADYILTAETAIGEGRGMCGELGLSAVQADEMIGSKGYKSWAVGGYLPGGGHMVRMVELQADGQKIVFDGARKKIAASDNFFSGITGIADGMRPADILDGKGNVIALFNRESKDIVLNKQDIKFDFKSDADRAVFDQVEKLGEMTKGNSPKLGTAPPVQTAVVRKPSMAMA